MADSIINLSFTEDERSPSKGIFQNDQQNSTDGAFLDELWSEDGFSDTDTSLSVTHICSLSFNTDENDDFQAKPFISHKNVTVRRKPKKSKFVQENCTNLEKGNNSYESKSSVGLHSDVCTSVFSLEKHKVDYFSLAQLKDDTKKSSDSDSLVRVNNFSKNVDKPHSEYSPQEENKMVSNSGKDSQNLSNSHKSNGNKNICKTSLFETKTTMQSQGVISSKSFSEEVHPKDDHQVLDDDCDENDFDVPSEIKLFMGECVKNTFHGNSECLHSKPKDCTVVVVSSDESDSNILDKKDITFTKNKSYNDAEDLQSGVCNIGLTNTIDESNVSLSFSSSREGKNVNVILSSDSEKEFLYNDSSGSEDDNCEKYNISLTTCLQNNPFPGIMHNKENRNFNDFVFTPSVKLSTPLIEERLDSTDDDEFEQFLEQIKTPKPKSTPKLSLNGFIVDDDDISNDSSESDDENDKGYSSGALDVKRRPRSVTKTSSVDKKRIEKKIATMKPDKKNVFPEKKLLTPKDKILKETSRENIPTNRKPRYKSVKSLMTPYKNTPGKRWQKSRELLVTELYSYYNETVFHNKLPADLPIIWNKKMTKTAGYCYYIGSMVKKCRIELSEKVVDSCDRIRDTLIHELCHAAAWLIDGVKAGHGPQWKRWANKAMMLHSDLPPISRCHSYDINYKFTYKCVMCQHSFGRHSKSVNLKIARCPICLSHLKLLPQMNKDGTPRAPSKFSLFIKDNYRKIKSANQELSHQDVMKELSKQFAEVDIGDYHEKCNRLLQLPGNMMKIYLNIFQIL